MQQGAIFQDDNARPHCGRVINNFISQQNIQKLKWPANLPDLNPIEHNIWDELGRRVYGLNLSQTLPQLCQQLMQEWVSILQRVIRECVQSMRRYCQACINSWWGQTRYQDYDLQSNLTFCIWILTPRVFVDVFHCIKGWFLKCFYRNTNRDVGTLSNTKSCDWSIEN